MSVRSLNGTSASGAGVVALLRVTAAFEAATAAGLLILPALMLALLFGSMPDTASSLLLARLFGAPLLSLSVMCWAASKESGGRAVLSHVAAMLLYNMIVAALLLYSAMILRLVGVALWPAVIAHALLAGWCVAGLAQGARRATEIDAAPGR
jgi:hypothetical protein